MTRPSPQDSDFEQQLSKQLNSTAAFGVPEGYFENLTQEIENQIILEKLQVTKQLPYQVPSGYWEQARHRTIKKIVTRQSPIVVMLQAKSTWYISMAAAACFALLMYFNINTPLPTSINATSHQEVDITVENTYLFAVNEEDLIDLLATSLNSDTTNQIEEALLNENISTNEIEYEL